MNKKLIVERIFVWMPVVALVVWVSFQVAKKSGWWAVIRSDLIIIFSLLFIALIIKTGLDEIGTTGRRKK